MTTASTTSSTTSSTNSSTGTPGLASGPTATRPAAASSGTPPRAPRLVWRVRLLAVVVGLAAISFRQSPGLVVPDTKLDLTADPAGFLARALHLWDPQGALGQLQNQAYGYLFPVGPFHLALGAAGLPAWVVQRLWWTTIMVVALFGMWRLARAFGVRQDWARLTVAVLYALGPRVLSEVAVTSVEVWPLAVAPWVLLPLVVPGRSTRWRATRSGLALACVGGVNAVASGAVLVLPVLWLATRRWDRRLVRLSAAWGVAVLVASAWWVLPLLVLGRYSPPFLSWIENATVTTSTASPFEALRGTTPWLGFLTSPAGPSWPAAWLLVTSPLLIVATTAVASLGLCGTVLRRTPQRPFLVLAVAVGLALVTLGSPAGGWAGELVRHLLDGPLAPLRNTHKFELVVRIPLLIGLAHLLARAHEALAGRRAAVPRGARRALSTVVVTSLLVIACAPAIGSAMARPEGYRAIPDHWRQAAAWLDAQPGAGAVLVAPAASFSDLTWGSTKDEPLQALSRRPFVVRDAVPLGSAGATRLLDAVEDRLATGQRVDGLASVLADAGIAYVLVRNEIRLDAQGAPPLAVTRALLASGARRVASFGPPVGSLGESETVTVDRRTLVARPAIEVYAVSGSSAARLVPAADLTPVAGGPENLMSVAEALGQRDVVMGDDVRAVPAGTVATPWVLTDGMRRREVDFGAAADNTSGLLAADDPGRSGRAVIDYDPGSSVGRTTLRWAGVASVTASSSASDANATLRLGPSHGPAAALDGDLRTRWVSGSYGSAVGQWLRVEFTAPRDVTGTTVSLSGTSPVGAAPVQVRVETATGSRLSEVHPGPILQLLTPPGRTGWLRITLVRVAPGTENGFSVNEIGVPGLQAHPTAVLPPTAGTPSAVLLEEGRRGRAECLTVDAVARCAPSLVREAEETGWARTWSADETATYAVSGTVRPIDGPALERLLSLPSGVETTASSRLIAAPAGRPDAGMDGDPGTGWVAADVDPAPWFRVRLPERRRLTGLTLTKAFDLAASTPVGVTVTFDDGTSVTRQLDSRGRITFPAKRTRELTVHFGAVRLLEDIDSATGRHTYAPTGFSELVLQDAEDLSQPVPTDLATGVPCGFGPTIELGDRRVLTSVTGQVADLLTGGSLRWQVCQGGSQVTVPVGRQDLRVRATAEFAPERLSLVGEGAPTGPAVRSSVALDRPTPSEARAQLPERSAPAVLVVPQNFSAGWEARAADGRLLTPIRVNGWQQGWVVPAGPATLVSAAFAPDTSYRVGLLIGAVLLLVGVALALTTRRERQVGGCVLPAARGVVPVACGGVILVWSAGSAGVAALLLTGAVALVARGGRARRALLAVAAVAPPAVAVAVAVAPWPGGRLGLESWWVQAGVWLGVAAALCVVLGDEWPAPRVRTRRITGRSTSR